jgi:hypothetical protein
MGGGRPGVDIPMTEVREDIFYEAWVLDEETDAHRPLASFDRLSTGLGQKRGRFNSLRSA